MEETKINEQINVGDELEQLSKMDANTRAELLKTYHHMLMKTVNDAMYRLNEIVKLSPATVGVSGMGIILAEYDDFDDKRDGSIHCLGCIGNAKKVARLLTKIFDKLPEQIVDEFMKSQGFVKESAKETA